jgi:hypothetical protein
MTKAGIKEPVIYIEGFNDPEHYTRNILLKDIVLPEDSRVYLKNCDKIIFENVLSDSGKKPVFDMTSSTNIRN